MKDKLAKSSTISSLDVVTPVKHSSFYEEFMDKLESNRWLLDKPTTAENYKEKYHHLICWEEQEHEKQLTERYCGLSYILIYYIYSYRINDQHVTDGYKHAYNYASFL